MDSLQNLYEAILDVRFDRRNFSSMMLKTGVLVEEPDGLADAPAGPPEKYRFNAEKYAELRQGGFRLEF